MNDLHLERTRPTNVMHILGFMGLVAKVEDVSEVPIWVPLFMRKFQRY